MLLRACSRLPFLRFSRRAYHALVDVHPQVQDALLHNKPVVALESVIITHGFPHDASPRVALSLESIVRSTGAVPATIAILDGRIKVGLEPHQISQLACSSAVKISRRDIGPALGLGVTGGTTICSTSIFASLVGIKVFSTGGLGGVHRGAESSMDISADLTELARTQIAVVSAGVKSILDIGRTLEYLETCGVPVISFSDTLEFPAFFSRQSGFRAPWNSDSPQTVAAMLDSQWKLGLQNGAVIAAPIPKEYEAQGATIQQFVDQAVAESEANGISKLGKEVTPWLLKRVGELSQGTSQQSNIALLENTALIGGKIAVEYAKLQTDQPLYSVFSLPPTGDKPSIADATPTPDSKVKGPCIAILGSSAVDVTCRPSSESADNRPSPPQISHTTTPGTVSLSFGGVARNIAEAAHRVLQSTQFPQGVVLVTPTVNDAFGQMLTTDMLSIGMRVDGFIPCGPGQRTAVCNIFLDGDGNLINGIADMGVCEALPAKEVVSKIDSLSPDVLCFDGNLQSSLMQNVIQTFKKRSRLVFEPTSSFKSKRLLKAIASVDIPTDAPPPIDIATPNILELREMFQAAREYGLTESERWWTTIEGFQLGSDFRMKSELWSRNTLVSTTSASLEHLHRDGVITMAIQLLPYIRNLVVKLGDKGVLLVQHLTQDAFTKNYHRKSPMRGIAAGSTSGAVMLQHFNPFSVPKMVNDTGVGDSFLGALLASLFVSPSCLEDPVSLQEAIDSAQQAAILTLQAEESVAKGLSQSPEIKASPRM